MLKKILHYCCYNSKMCTQDIGQHVALRVIISLDVNGSKLNNIQIQSIMGDAFLTQLRPSSGMCI